MLSVLPLPLPPQTFVFSLWKSLFLSTRAGLDLWGCLDVRCQNRCTQGEVQLQDVFVFYSFSPFPPCWMTWLQHLSPCWEARENVLREHYLVKLPLPLLHRSRRSESLTKKTGISPVCGRNSLQLAQRQSCSVWIGVYFCCECFQNIRCTANLKLATVAPRFRNPWLPHCTFYFSCLQNDALGSGQDPKLDAVPSLMALRPQPCGAFRWAAPAHCAPLAQWEHPQSTNKAHEWALMQQGSRKKGDFSSQVQ